MTIVHVGRCILVPVFVYYALVCYCKQFGSRVNHGPCICACMRAYVNVCACVCLNVCACVCLRGDNGCFVIVFD